ncbi:MAG: D-alanine--D-alanine ligase [Actinobacteria bacterium]|nr:D-alanine--D-alanine ligase [Actinomycetota bacterium]
MGGRSSEHEVSRSSGAGVLAALAPDRYDVSDVLIERDGRWHRDGTSVALVVSGAGAPVLLDLDTHAEHPVDVVFPVLHGPYGEDGTIQGLCDTVGVACVGSGVAASAVAMDKALFKDLMRIAGVDTVAHHVVHAREWASDRHAVIDATLDAIGVPAFVKPARLGSSVGISRVLTVGELAPAITLALTHDAKVLVEQAVMDAREVEVGVLGNDHPVASPVGQIEYESDWYDYETKYLPDRMRLRVPAEISDDIADRVCSAALTAFDAAGCRGLARADFFATGDGRVLISELNTMPGFTPTSVYAKLFEGIGVSYGDLIDRLIALAFEDFEGRCGYRA